ncbi:hypothetical protein CFC21_014348 [Triticum aestivum]|uniref:Uncharacterized protein n=3 Tax=Triticum TaxID=4564 RepID=A0A9R1NFY5_TRITD|nr:hypothetical protein CFC21_014348 [Triticum aestivum]VAH24206.1 unnamed protein product [Triticum turgidum subsp. durum]
MSRPQARSSSYRKKAAGVASSHHHNHGSKAHYVHGGRPAPRWPARVMDGFRKMLVGLFAFPPRPPKVTFSANARGGGEDAVAPKRPSCSSSNLQPVNNAHYDEAISDCVEFFHRSARVDVRSRPSSAAAHF